MEANQMGISPISCVAFLVTSLVVNVISSGQENRSVLRAGIIGLDTSHAPAFTKALNDPKATGALGGVRVVAAFAGGSPDIASSRDRVKQITEQVRGMGVEIVDSIPALLAKVDVVMLESVDGRPHLEQARAVFEAGKPVYIDKPLAGSLVDVLAIAELGEKHHTPWFSSSSLRYGAKIDAIKRDARLGDVVGCEAWSPCHLEPTHPDLYWYGIHGVELLYTMMGPGCESVSRVQTEGTDVAVGRWKGGRVGTFRGIRQGKQDYGAVVFGSKGISTATGFEGYVPLVEQIATFFKTRKPPIAVEETIEIYAFMEAADESKRNGGKPVAIQEVMEKARSQLKANAG
ncbi:MAG TPA: Gfo/Idh/MocA family oxidoreductase [Tepidisphaeraceae bacterium]